MHNNFQLDVILVNHPSIYTQNFHEEQLHSRFPGKIANSNRFSIFPGFPEAVDTQYINIAHQHCCADV